MATVKVSGSKQELKTIFEFVILMLGAPVLPISDDFSELVEYEYNRSLKFGVLDRQGFVLSEAIRWHVVKNGKVKVHPMYWKIDE